MHECVALSSTGKPAAGGRSLPSPWGPEVLEWTIAVGPQGARLELRQTLSNDGHASRYAAGWRVCLGRLAAEQDGVERERVVGERAWAYGCRDLIDHYQRTLDTTDTTNDERRTTDDGRRSEPVSTTFRGVFLTSSEPGRTAAFYRDIAGLALETVTAGSYTYWRLDREGMQIAIHDAESFADYASPPNPGSNLTHLYFHIEDHSGFLAHLRMRGLEPIAVDDVVITVTDPDGRNVMFGTA